MLGRASTDVSVILVQAVTQARSSVSTDATLHCTVLRLTPCRVYRVNDRNGRLAGTAGWHSRTVLSFAVCVEHQPAASLPLHHHLSPLSVLSVVRRRPPRRLACQPEVHEKAKRGACNTASYMSQETHLACTTATLVRPCDFLAEKERGGQEERQRQPADLVRRE